MKFHAAWDSLEKENRNLKILVIFLCTLSIFLTVTVTGTATKDPLIVERTCYSKVLKTASEPVPTEEEIKIFLELALSARFDSEKSQSKDLLSLRQQGYREKEQLELKKQKMNQKLIFYDAKITKDSITVLADRLIAIENLRSVLRFPLKVQLEATERSESNPYGLVLSDVSPEGEEKKE